MGNSPSRHANNIYSSGSDKLTEVQLYISALCQAGSRIMRAFLDDEKPVLFSEAAKSENKKDFLISENVWISSQVNKFY